MDRYIKKPTDFDTLKKVLHKVLSAAYVLNLSVLKISY
jgi:hypothetical protein